MDRGVVITKRVEPCNCGCKGGDPWHRATYRRRLANVQLARDTRKVHAFREPVFTTRTATVQMPWNKKAEVVEVVWRNPRTEREHSLGWFLVDGAIET